MARRTVDELSILLHESPDLVVARQDGQVTLPAGVTPRTVSAARFATFVAAIAPMLGGLPESFGDLPPEWRSPLALPAADDPAPDDDGPRGRDQAIAQVLADVDAQLTNLRHLLEPLAGAKAAQRLATISKQLHDIAAPYTRQLASPGAARTRARATWQLAALDLCRRLLTPEGAARRASQRAAAILLQAVCVAAQVPDPPDADSLLRLARKPRPRGPESH